MADTEKTDQKEVTESQTSSDSSSLNELDPDTVHKLQFNWSIWYSAPTSDVTKRGWLKRHQKLIDMTTVQDFWRVFNNFVAPSALDEGADIHFFRQNVEPEWEDHYNTQGGAFQLFLHLQTTNFAQLAEHADAVWLNILLHMIGDHFDDADEIVGLIVSKRHKGFRFSLWIKTASDVDARKRIAKQLRRISDSDNTNRIKFMSHEDSKVNNSKGAKFY